MTQPLAARGVVRLAGIFVACAALACAKSDRKSDSTAAASASDSTARAVAAAAPSAATAPGAPQAPEPGALPKPIDQMSGDELYTFTQALSYGGGHERRRRCRGRQGCRGPRPTDSTMLKIDAIQLEDSLSANDLAANGVIGARLLNVGSYPDSLYNTRPGKQYEYFLLLTKAGTGVANWRLEELTTTAGQREHHSVASGVFHPCNHAFRKGARADFKTCAESAADDMKPAAFRRGATAFFQGGGGDSPIWIACAFGCCTAGPPDAQS